MAGRRKALQGSGDIARAFQSEDNKNFRIESQDLRPVAKHVEKIRHMHEHSTRASNPNEWMHIGSVPQVVLIDWLNKHNYTMDMFARNDGGDYNRDGDAQFHLKDPGVKSQFLRYFLSRDFSKLHNQHVTTKKESSQIFMPS